MAEVFLPALESDEIQNGSVVRSLAGGVEALRVSGLVDDDAADDLLRRLELARIEASERTRPPLSRARPLEPPPTDPLRGIAVPLAALIDIEDTTLVLRTVEFWQRGTRLRAAYMRTALTDTMDADHEAELEAWAAEHRGERERGIPVRRPPHDAPGMRRLEAVALTLRDDIGTTYSSSSWMMSGGGNEWEMERGFAPGVPLEASSVHVDVGDHAGRTVNSVTIDLATEVIRPSW